MLIEQLKELLEEFGEFGFFMLTNPILKNLTLNSLLNIFEVLTFDEITEFHDIYAISAFNGNCLVLKEFYYD